MRSRIGSDKERLAHSKCSKVFTLTHYITASSALMIKSIITSWALPTSFPVPTDVTTALKEKCICCFLLMEPVDGTYSAITWSNEHCPFTEGAATSPLTFFISFSASSKVDSVSQIKKLTQYIKLQRVPSHFCLRCCTHSPQEQPLFPPAASQGSGGHASQCEQVLSASSPMHMQHTQWTILRFAATPPGNSPRSQGEPQLTKRLLQTLGLSVHLVWDEFILVNSPATCMDLLYARLQMWRHMYTRGTYVPKGTFCGKSKMRWAPLVCAELLPKSHLNSLWQLPWNYCQAHNPMWGFMQQISLKAHC